MTGTFQQLLNGTCSYDNNLSMYTQENQNEITNQVSICKNHINTDEISDHIKYRTIRN